MRNEKKVSSSADTLLCEAAIRRSRASLVGSIFNDLCAGWKPSTDGRRQTTDRHFATVVGTNTAYQVVVAGWYCVNSIATKIVVY